MKVLMTTDTVGGVWTYAVQLAGSLAEYDVAVDLATQGPALSDSQRRDAQALPNLRLHESGYRLEWMHDPWEDVQSAGRWLQQLARTLHPDIIHLNDYSHGALPRDAPVIVVGHSCVLSWHRAVRGTSAGPEWNSYRRSVTNGLRGADLVVAPTAAMLATLESDYGPFLHSEVIPNGRDRVRDGRDRVYGSAAAAKQSYVFTAGRLWDEAKNIGALDAAAPLISWPAYAAGDVAAPDGCAVEFSALECLGRLSPELMEHWLEAASIYVHPARYEPFGLVPLEAAQCCCALVLGDIPSLREIWENAACFVSPDDPSELAAAINRLIDEPQLRNFYAEQARRRADSFTADRMARRYVRAYRRLTAANAEPRPAGSCGSNTSGRGGLERRNQMHHSPVDSLRD